MERTQATRTKSKQEVLGGGTPLPSSLTRLTNGRPHTECGQAYVRDHPDEFLQPNGFVYHETRTGSTLVANMLALVPTNLVVSESSLSEDPARRCASCSPKQKTQLLRDVLTLMGSTQAGHTHLFFKFQDSTTLGEVCGKVQVAGGFCMTWLGLFRG